MNPSTQEKLPQFRCHKVVKAVKIQTVEASSAGALLTPEDSNIPPFRVPPQYVNRCNPAAGGYFVLYEDGFTSWSPPEAFENGYEKIWAAAPHPYVESHPVGSRWTRFDGVGITIAGHYTSEENEPKVAYETDEGVKGSMGEDGVAALSSRETTVGDYSKFVQGSKWITPNGLVINVVRCSYTVDGPATGRWRLDYTSGSGGGHMGKNHMDRLIPAHETWVQNESTPVCTGGHDLLKDQICSACGDKTRDEAAVTAAQAAVTELTPLLRRLLTHITRPMLASYGFDPDETNALLLARTQI